MTRRSDFVPMRVIGRVLQHLDEVDGCWVSRYTTGNHGYAQVSWKVDGVIHWRLAHRVAYEALVGEIHSGLTVDHLCRNRKCINPDHLRLLTNEENGRLNGHAVKTHCLYGHPYDDANTYRNPKGHRYCRQCARLARLARAA